MKKCIRLSMILCIVLGMLVFTACGTDEGDENVQKGAAPTVAAPTGTYSGNINDGVQEYLGIKYAAPVDRWKAPTDATTTVDDEIDATEWGPCCIQPYNEVEIASQGELSEDCLNLNIWTKDVTTEGKPVMIFIHGGGFMNGGSHDPMYEGDTIIRNLAEDEDMVFISINYRTNIFGSMDLSQIKGYTDEYADAINLWYLDQVQALKWINENVEAFGGDSNNITVTGQSCGGMSIAYLLSMDQPEQYFQKAIIESGAPFIAQTSREQKLGVAEVVMDELKVDNLDELLAVSENDIKENCLEAVFEHLQGLSDIYADGKIIPTDWWDRIRAGSAKNVKVMIGSMSGENDWAAYDYDNMPEALKEPQTIWDWYVMGDVNKKGADTKYLINPADAEGNPVIDLEAYLKTDEDEVKAMTDLYNAMCYTQGTEYMAEALSEYNDTYHYYWTYAPDPESVVEYCLDNDMEPEVSPYGRPLHSMGTLFALGNLDDGYCEISGDPEKIPEGLSEMMQSAWVNFAKTGNPNSDLIPQWKLYDSKNRTTMVMDEEWKLVNDPRKEQREIMNIRPIGEK